MTPVRQEVTCLLFMFFFSSRRRHTRFDCDWSSDVCSSDLAWRSIFGGKFAPKHGVVRPSSYVSLTYSAVTNTCLHRGSGAAVRDQLAGLGDRASGFARAFLHGSDRFCGLALR